MPRTLIEAGRVEIRGASVRFKQKATLTAFDRNLAALEGARVRATPIPGARLFVDLDFPGEVFRVWQDQTLVNYRDFLERVEFSGLENFRALLRYLTKALPAEKHDVVTREFADGKAAERFTTNEELAAYDAAIAAGEAPPIREKAASTPPADPLDRRAAAEQAWKQFAPDLAKARAERNANGGNEAFGVLLAFMGVAMMGVTLVAMVRVMRAPDSYPEHTGSVIAVGMMLALALLIGAAVYLVRARSSARRE